MIAIPASAAAQSQRRTDPADTTSSGYRADVASQPAVRAAELEGSEPAMVSIEMTAQLADNLALLFDRFDDSEFILCLEGVEERSGELRLRDFRMPHLAYSRSTSAGVHPDGNCGQYAGVVGTVHNHPARYPRDAGREWKNCYLSRTDIVSWLKYSDYEYAAVMCGPRTWAWWHRSQVDPDKLVAFPPSGQLIGRTEPAKPNAE